MNRIKFIVAVFLAGVLSLTSGCSDKSARLRDGVTYAKNALLQVGVNPFATATYDSIVRNGGSAAKYVAYTLPKKDPVFDSFEDKKPSHPWTIVIRPSGAANELSIEGYGLDLKRPDFVEYVKVSLPAE